MFSTKKQKMMISRSVVEKIRKELNPPGRFLQKDSDGKWSEVPLKKALEKTAQALRDGAFRLKKEMELSDDSSVATGPRNLLGKQDRGALLGNNASAAEAKLISQPLKHKSHRRQASTPISLNPKRSRPNDLSNELSQSLTGVNFPSLGVDNDNTKLLNESNGVSCSDKNVSDMHIDEICSLFARNSGKTYNQQQQNMAAIPDSQGLSMLQMPLDSSSSQWPSTRVDQYHLQNAGGVDMNQKFDTNTNDIGQHQLRQSFESAMLASNHQINMNLLSASNNLANTFDFNQNQSNQNMINANPLLTQQFSGMASNQQPYMAPTSNNNFNAFSLNQNAQLFSSTIPNQQTFMPPSSNNNANTSNFNQTQGSQQFSSTSPKQQSNLPSNPNKSDMM